ncbi:hypothetical protein PVAP13_5NG305181 [Panicum virgatum]|uniref:Uncharacterized protein n=1 Tax=Panicum virgatum TaxID=38727 RepID=A0A8T0RU45_PANVG|nr:hypothetical protein PVAP13_5NG305181 [Panicum virgatum]
MTFSPTHFEGGGTRERVPNDCPEPNRSCAIEQTPPLTTASSRPRAARPLRPPYPAALAWAPQPTCAGRHLARPLAVRAGRIVARVDGCVSPPSVAERSPPFAQRYPPTKGRPTCVRRPLTLHRACRRSRCTVLASIRPAPPVAGATREELQEPASMVVA